jgi:hypothetical protein
VPKVAADTALARPQSGGVAEWEQASTGSGSFNGAATFRSRSVEDQSFDAKVEGNEEVHDSTSGLPSVEGLKEAFIHAFQKLQVSVPTAGAPEGGGTVILRPSSQWMEMLKVMHTPILNLEPLNYSLQALLDSLLLLDPDHSGIVSSLHFCCLLRASCVWPAHQIAPPLLHQVLQMYGSGRVCSLSDGDILETSAAATAPHIVVTEKRSKPCKVWFAELPESISYLELWSLLFSECTAVLAPTDGISEEETCMVAMPPLDSVLAATLRSAEENMTEDNVGTSEPQLQTPITLPQSDTNSQVKCFGNYFFTFSCLISTAGLWNLSTQ